MATKADVVTRALRRLRVVAANRAPTADLSAETGTVLDSLFAEIGVDHAISWTLDTTPDEALNPLADLLAAEIAPEYSKAAPMPRSRALTRFLAVINPDDRLIRPAEYF